MLRAASGSPHWALNRLSTRTGETLVGTRTVRMACDANRPSSKCAAGVDSYATVGSFSAPRCRVVSHRDLGPGAGW